MQNTFWNVAKWVVILGTVGIALNILFGERTMIFVEKGIFENTNALVWYKFNVNGYITQLQTAITNTTELELKLPTLTWYKGEINTIELFGYAVKRNLAVICNYIVLIINVLCYPLKVGGYVMRFVLALLGLNYNDPKSSINWLGNMANTLIGLSIPYIDSVV